MIKVTIHVDYRIGQTVYLKARQEKLPGCVVGFLARPLGVCYLIGWGDATESAHWDCELSETYGLAVANVFHAGDGNLHPLILYDANKPGELERTEKFGADILKLCVEVGGVLTGEHGVGVEKRDLMPAMFSEVDLKQQQRLKCAFDDEGLLNPGKVFPTLHRCAELGRMHVHAGRVAFPDIPRF